MLGLISYNCTMTIQDNLDNQIVIYQTADGQTQIDVKMQEETVWLTQDMIVRLFDSSKLVNILSIFMKKENLIKFQLFGNSEQFDKKVKDRFRGS